MTAGRDVLPQLDTLSGLQGVSVLILIVIGLLAVAAFLLARWTAEKPQFPHLPQRPTNSEQDDDTTKRPA
jgi:hypothetical protein